MLSKKRKRQQRLEEEMAWNDGLRTFVQRRDVWAGAKRQSSLQHQTPLPTKASYSTSPHLTNGTPPPTPTTPCPTLLPLPPPLLPPTNPIRASIKPETYPQIYDKIILLGQTPSIPINLSDTIHALVAGWKKDGEWPPKGEAGDVGEAGTKRLARRSVGRVKRVFGMGRGGGGREE